MNGLKCKSNIQLTLDDDFNVPDVKPDIEKIMKEQGILLIYDFWITDKMQGSTEYTNWYQNEYLKRFPKPPRNENIWKQEEMPEYFKIQNQIFNLITIQISFLSFGFNCAAYIPYLFSTFVIHNEIPFYYIIMICVVVM